MKKTTPSLVILLLTFLLTRSVSFAQYNEVWIPPIQDASSYNLNIYDTIKQLVPTGNQTVTIGINGDFWGPTLVLHQGQNVQMNVTNYLNDSTTVHWHGMHLPAVMDGGPHQVIPPGSTWSPYWTVNNRAGFYWYHPHLHSMTAEQILKGMGGFLIVQDSEESALNLPRTYGSDDFPLVLTSRKFSSSNQIVLTDAYGDYMLVNGTRNPKLTIPKQLVRLRILNVENERGFDLGFSDNRNFTIIANDGGLLNAPMTVNRVKLMVGERIEILVDLSNETIGSTLELMAYNANQAFGFPGGEPNTTGAFGSLLNNTNFNVLHLVIGNPTQTPVVGIPSVLSNQTYWTESQATVNRTIQVTGGQPGIPFTLNNSSFALNTINYHVQLDDVEKWTLVNNQIFGHSFHIHDVQFKITSRNGSAANVGSHEQGWKDVVYLPRNENVTFVCKFNDYSDALHPFMYHCHFGQHEDGGMMGQFVVDQTNSLSELAVEKLILKPNPVEDKLFLIGLDDPEQVYYIRIFDQLGRTMYMLPKPNLTNGIDVSKLPSGNYLLELTDQQTKSIHKLRFIKK